MSNPYIFLDVHRSTIWKRRILAKSRVHGYSLLENGVANLPEASE